MLLRARMFSILRWRVFKALEKSSSNLFICISTDNTSPFFLCCCDSLPSLSFKALYLYLIHSGSPAWPGYFWKNDSGSD